MKQNRDQLNQPVKTVARKDVATLQEDRTVRQALDAIRDRGVGERIVYFYVVDQRDRLAGVVPTRRLLTAPLEERLANIMVRRVVAIPETATVLEACEAFVLHKFLAFPVVDYRRQVVGVLDVDLFTNQVFDNGRAFWREAGTSLLLGTACGTVVGIIVWLWRGAGLEAISIGASILLTLCAACFFGLTVPAVLHAFKLDPRIAAGPVTLAFTDIFTLLFYFSLGALLL